MEEGERSSHSITQRQPKGTSKGGGAGSEKRKREKGAVTVCHKGATKGTFKRWEEEEIGNESGTLLFSDRSGPLL